MKINLGEGSDSQLSGNLLLEVVVGCVVTFATVLGCIFFVNLLDEEVTVLQKDVRELEVQINQDSSLRKKREVYKSKKDDLKKKNEAIAILESKQIGPVFLFSELSDLVSNRIFFTDLIFETTTVQIKGRAIDNLVLADFLMRLDDSEYFSSVKLETSKHELFENIELMNFSILGKIRLPRYE